MLLVGSVVAQSNASIVSQMGTANDALVVQAGLSNVSDVSKRPILDVNQLGQENNSTVKQLGSVPISGLSNDATVNKLEIKKTLKCKTRWRFK
jgi:hypothetical protein